MAAERRPIMDNPMDRLYRVQKDGRSFYIPREQGIYYLKDGYELFKTVEQSVTAEELGEGEKDG